MVCVLLSTFNGERYLEKQLQSLINQKGVDITIVVRDDGSTDGTIDILNRWQSRGKLTWYTGENLRPAKSFMNLLMCAPDAEYYAFCDQDDIWLENKLKTAVDALKNIGSQQPALYYCQWQMVDEDLSNIPTPKLKVRGTFGESILTNPAAGCTQVFNRRLLEIIRSYMPSYISMHDSWVYRVCLAVGAQVVFDKNAYILYRQHQNNVLGGTSSIYKRLRRRLKTSLKDPHQRSRTVTELINGYRDVMPKANYELLLSVANYSQSISNKIKLILNKSLRTENKETNLMFLISILLNKF